MADTEPAGAVHPAPPAGKRERLVAAAREILYHQGVARTTLADIAQRAEVATGNVYYYFKTKDAIIGAVVEAHAAELTAAVAALEHGHRSPRTRLKALLGALAEQREPIALYGCLYGSLCSEVAKGFEGPNPLITPLMQVPLDFAARQFREMGRLDAADLAVDLIASYQGSALLCSTLGRPELVARQTRRLCSWIDELDP